MNLKEIYVVDEFERHMLLMNLKLQKKYCSDL